MDTVLLFRKRTPLTDDRLPWLRGAEEHSWTARRNASGKGVVSAILVRALLSALDGSVLEAHRSRSANHVRAVVRSHSTPDTAAECWLDWSSGHCGVPYGEETKVTYHPRRAGHPPGAGRSQETNMRRKKLRRSLPKGLRHHYPHPARMCQADGRIGLENLNFDTDAFSQAVQRFQGGL